MKIGKTLFYICGNEEIYDAIETDIEDPSGSDPHECKLREFKLKARYLLFCRTSNKRKLIKTMLLWKKQVLLKISNSIVSLHHNNLELKVAKLICVCLIFALQTNHLY